MPMGHNRNARTPVLSVLFRPCPSPTACPGIACRPMKRPRRWLGRARDLGDGHPRRQGQNSPSDKEKREEDRPGTPARTRSVGR